MRLSTHCSFFLEIYMVSIKVGNAWHTYLPWVVGAIVTGAIVVVAIGAIVVTTGWEVCGTFVVTGGWAVVVITDA